MWGAGYLLKVFGNAILHEDYWEFCTILSHGCTLFTRIYVRAEPRHRTGGKPEFGKDKTASGFTEPNLLRGHRPKGKSLQILVPVSSHTSP